MEDISVLESERALINMMNSKWSLLGETTLTVLNSWLVDNFSQLWEEGDGGWSGGLEDRMVNLLHLCEHHVRRQLLVMRVRPGGHHLEGLVVRRLRCWGDQLECLMRPGGRHVFLLDVLHMFMLMLRKRSGQYLHVSQSEHLLRLLERNLHDTVFILWWWRWWWLIVSGRDHLVVPRVVLGVMCWGRLCK